MMNIFDFIPPHLRTSQDSQHSAKDPINPPIQTASNLTFYPQQDELLVPSHIARPEQYKLMLQEWEQACYSEWVEMEQDICLFTA